MKYAIEMDSGGVIYIPSLITIGLSIQKLMGWETRTHGQYGDLTSKHLWFQNKESRLKVLNVLERLVYYFENKITIGRGKLYKKYISFFCITFV
jgi:hypothetical protein